MSEYSHITFNSINDGKYESKMTILQENLNASNTNIRDIRSQLQKTSPDDGSGSDSTIPEFHNIYNITPCSKPKQLRHRRETAVEGKAKETIRRRKENIPVDTTHDDKNGKRKIRKPRKKNDSFIVSDSSSIENDSIVVYHRIVADRIKADVETMTPKHHLKKGNSSSDEEIFTPFRRRGKLIISSDSESDSSVKETHFSDVSRKSKSLTTLDVSLNRNFSLLSFSIVESAEPELTATGEWNSSSLKSKNTDLKDISSSSSDHFHSCCSDDDHLRIESLTLEAPASISDDEFKTPCKEFPPSEGTLCNSPTLFSIPFMSSPKLRASISNNSNEVQAPTKTLLTPKGSQSCIISVVLAEQIKQALLTPPARNMDGTTPEVEKTTNMKEPVISVNSSDSAGQTNDDDKASGNESFVTRSEESFNFRASSTDDDEFKNPQKPKKIFTPDEKPGHAPTTFKKAVNPKLTSPIVREVKNAVSKVEKISATKISKSFLESLSVLDSSCVSHPQAEIYKKKFKKLKMELAEKLYRLYNENVFDNQLPSTMKIEWSTRMRKTAGFCRCFKKPNPNGPNKEYLRTAEISLSTKVIVTPDRLRDTLIHEMCHVAVFLVDSIDADRHGPYWKSWARKATQKYPELPKLTTCHNYDIYTKYQYRCNECGYSFGRHSKSLDLKRKRCGYCHGKFELIVNRKTKSGGVNVSPKSVSAKPLSKFALFVKENYANVKSENLGSKHSDIMKELSKNFALTKIT